MPIKLSIVTTLYQSEQHVVEFHERASAAAKKLVGQDYQIIFVNDGSLDESLNLALGIVGIDPKSIVIDLSRNFGHHKAIMTGLAYAEGQLIFLIDSDLEEDPEWLLSFSQQIQIKPCDVIYGVQKKRKGSWFERWSGGWFYPIFRIMTGINLPKNAVTARLMTRRYLNALLGHKEREIFLAGLWHITGFIQHAQPINKHNTSKSTYSLYRKISLFVNSITSFSNLPLIAIFYIGIIILLIALLFIFYLIFFWVFFAKPPTGWPSVIASIWLFSGMIISFIGVIGIYLSKIFNETKQRPYTIVREIHAGKSK